MKYRTIVADPPWHYERTGISFADKTSGRFTGTGLPYGSMSVDEIAALPVAEIARDGAHLYVWTTQRYLWDTPRIAAAWGFKPVKRRARFGWDYWGDESLGTAEMGAA